jgi:hypothetical protein
MTVPWIRYAVGVSGVRHTVTVARESAPLDAPDLVSDIPPIRRRCA